MSRNVTESPRVRATSLRNLCLSTLSLLLVAGIFLVSERHGAEASNETVTIGPLGTVGTHQLPLTGQTYDQVRDLLATEDGFAIPLDIDGLGTLSNLSVTANADDTAHTVTMTASINSFTPPSPLAGLSVALTLMADWAAPGTDTVPGIVLALSLTDVGLETIFPAWGTIPGVTDPARLSEAVVLLTPTPGMSVDLSTLETLLGVAGVLDGPVTLEGPVELLANLDFVANPAFAAAATLFGRKAEEAVILAGTLAGTAAFLFDENSAISEGDFSLDGPISIDSGQLPGWLQNHVPEFRLRIAEGVASGRVHGSGDIVSGGVTNTVTYDVALSEAQDLSAVISVPSFNVPFGLDGLGWSTDFEEVSFEFRRVGGNFSGAFRATVPIAGADTVIHIGLDNADASKMTVVSVEGAIPLPSIVSLLSGGTFAGGDYAQLNFTAATLDAVEFSFYHDAAETVLGLYGAISGLDALGADGLRVRLLVGLDNDAGGTTLLAALRVDDATCSADCIYIHQVLEVPNFSLTADIQVPAVNFAVVVPDGAPFSSDRLGAEAKALLDEVNGSPAPAPYVVTGDLNFMAELPLAGVSPLLTPLGITPAGPSVHLQGSAGVTLPFFDDVPNSGTLDNFSVEAVIGGVGATAPQGFPDWLTFPSTGEWKLFLRFAEGEPGADDDTLEVGASVSGINVAPSLMNVPSVTLSAVFSGQVSGGSPDWTIVASAVLDDAWEAPFGVGFLTVQDASAVLTIDHPVGGPTTASAELCGTFDIGGVMTTVCFAISNATTAQATFRISLDEPVSLQEMTGLIGMSIALPAAVGSASLDGELDFTVNGTGIFSINAVVSASFTPFTDPIGIDLMLAASFGGGPPTVAVGVQPHPGITLGDLLPPTVAVPFDLPLSGGPNTGFAFVYSTGDIDPDSPDLSPIVRDWFVPLFAGDPTDQLIPSGAHIIGSLALPEPLSQFVGTLGLEPHVLVSGGLSLDPLAVDISLALRLSDGLLPEFVDGAQLSIALELGAGPTLALRMEGDLFLKFKQGLDADIAGPLQDFGLNGLPVANPVGADDSCPRGGFNLPAYVEDGDDDPDNDIQANFCYDKLKVTIGAELGITASPPSVYLLAYGNLLSQNGTAPDYTRWSPLGIEAVGIGSLGAEVEISFAAGPPLSLNLKLGLYGDITLFDYDVSGAVKVGVSIVPAPTPIGIAVTPNFDGFRISLPDGLETNAIIDLANVLAEAAGADPVPYPSDFPNIALKNLFFSISPVGAPTVCIEQGLIFRGDLYINPPDDLDFDGGPPCDPSASPAVGYSVPQDESCEAMADAGCVAGVFFSLTPDGLIADGIIAPFELEPLQMRFDESQLVLRLTTSDQYLRIHGGVEIGPDRDNPDAIGRMAIEIKPTSAVFAGQIMAFGFNALVDGSVDVDPWNLFSGGEVGTLRLHVVLAAPELAWPQYESEDPDFTTEVADDLQQKLDQLSGAAALWLSVLDDFDDDPLGTLLELPGLLGFSTPFDDGLAELKDEYDATVAELDEYGLSPSFTLYDLLNGWGLDPVYGVKNFGLCVPNIGQGGDDCVMIPALTFGSICSDVIPGAGSECTEAEVEAALKAVFTGRIEQLLEFAGVDDGAAALDKLMDDLAGLSGAPLFGLQCAALDLNMTLLGGDNTLHMSLESTVFGQHMDLFFLWDFNDTVSSALELLDGYFAGDQADIPCQGPNQALFGAGGLGELVGEGEEFAPLRVSVAVSPGRIDEGQSTTATVSFDREVTEADGDRNITLNWGDGSIHTVTVGVGEQSVTAEHEYDDDTPSGTALDTYSVKAIDTGAGGFKATAHVVVANVAPSNLVLELDDSHIDENDEVELTVHWADAGAYDTHSVRVTWGDGAVETIQPAVGTRQVILTHRFLDDRPTGTPGPDPATIGVRVKDDDGGQVLGSASLSVSNAPPDPNSIEVTSTTIGDVKEGELREYTFTWDDPGTLDSYIVYISWDGDGTFEELWPAGSDRSLTVSHVFVDDHPRTETASDDLPVKVKVVDDDSGAAVSVEQIRVYNVPPSLCIVVDPAAADPVKGTDCPEVSLTIDEHGSITVRGVYQDPGVLDTHTVEIDWGYPAFATTTFTFAPDPLGPTVDGHPFEATKVYGDNGVYTITVTVKDDDTGQDVSTATITVNNVNPSVAIDESESTGAGDPGTLLADGSGARDDGALDDPTFVVRRGQPLTIGATATDPGSDDLGFSWDWGDGLSSNDFLVNPSGPDPFPSPTDQPRAVTAQFAHTWTRACLYSVGLTVLDDDGGTDSDATWVLVTGTERRIWAPGYWFNQYDLSKKNQNRLAEDTLECYLDAVNHLSRVFGANAGVFWQVSTFTQMRDALNTKQTSRDTEIMQRQLMAAWLNFVNGSIGWFDMVDTNGDRVPDQEFGQLIRESEHLRLEQSPTRAQLLAQEAKLKHANGD